MYLFRRDLRIADNPLLSEITRSYQQFPHPYTHLLPLYIFPAQQVEVSGFLSSDSERSPYPEARSNAAGFWRCGHHRAQFLAESVWDLKKSLEGLGNGLEVRVGMLGQVVQELLDAFKQDDKPGEVVSVWMTSEEGIEEKREEREVRLAVESGGKDFRKWVDEKYFIDEWVHRYRPSMVMLDELNTIAVETFRSRARVIYQMSSPPTENRSSRSVMPLGEAYRHQADYHHCHHIFHLRQDHSLYPATSTRQSSASRSRSNQA